MTDSNRIGQIDLRCKCGHIAAEVSPAVRWRWLAAMAMAASIDGIAVPSWKMRNHLVPAARVKSGGMAKKDRGILAGPFPEGDLNSIDRKSIFDGHF